MKNGAVSHFPCLLFINSRFNVLLQLVHSSWTLLSVLSLCFLLVFCDHGNGDINHPPWNVFIFWFVIFLDLTDRPACAWLIANGCKQSVLPNWTHIFFLRLSAASKRSDSRHQCCSWAMRQINQTLSWWCHQRHLHHDEEVALTSPLLFLSHMIHWGGLTKIG